MLTRAAKLCILFNEKSWKYQMHHSTDPENIEKKKQKTKIHYS